MQTASTIVSRIHGSGTRWSVRFSVATAFTVLFTALSLALPRQADAYTMFDRAGSPGWMQTPKTVARNVCIVALTGSCINHSAGIVNPARWVGESPSYPGAWQWVCINYGYWVNRYQAGSSGWQRMAAERKCAWISPSASSVSVAGSWARSEDASDLDAYFATTFNVTWQLQNGTVIGRLSWDYLDGGDYWCDAPLLNSLNGPMHCVVYDGVAGNSDAGIRLFWA